MAKCSSCHGTNFKSVNAAFTFLTTSTEKCRDYAKIVVLGMPAKSWMYAKILSATAELPKDCSVRMPKGGAALDAASIKKFEDWIKGGAVK